MKGYGWGCDNCGHKVIDRSASEVRTLGFLPAPPFGWWVLHGPSEDPACVAMPEERHFCSIDCAAACADGLREAQ